MKQRHFSAISRLSLPRVIQFGTAMATLVAGSAAHATDFYKANNTSSLNVSASWENLAGVAFVDPTKPTNTSATSDTDIWTWDARVLAANTSPLGNDLRVKTIRIQNPGGLVTIDGVTNNRTITVISGGGIDMSAATQDLTIQNLSTSTSLVGLRISSSGGNIGISVAANRNLTMLSKITAASNAAGTNSTVNFTGPGTLICNAEMMANRLNIASGEVQLNIAGGSARPGTGTTPFTNVTGGRLVVNNTSGSATGGGPVNVKDTATLTGQGIMTGLVTVESGGTLIPKENAIGSLTAGSLTLAAGSNIKWEGDPTPLSTSADLVAVTGSNGLTINGGTLNLYNVGTTTPFSGTGTYNIFSFSGIAPNTSNLSVAGSSKIDGQSYIFGVTIGTPSYVTLHIGADTRPKASWNVDADGTWSTGTNWTGGVSPNASTSIATLGGALGTPITAPRTVTLTGPSTVGTLNIDSAQPFTLAGPGVLTFDIGGGPGSLNVISGSHTISAPFYLPAAGLQSNIQDAASTLTLAATISGDESIPELLPGIAKSGPGTLIITGDNSYSGITSNSAGTLQIGAGGTTGSVLGSIINNGTLRINRSEPFRFIHGISGSGNVDFAGTGTSTLAVPNTYSGTTTISAGTVEIEEPAALQGSTLNYSSTGGALTYLDGITSLVLGGLSGDKPLPPLSYTSSLFDPPVVLSMSLTVGQNNASTSYSASTTGTGNAFTKTGSGTFSLSGTHAFSGATTINGGVLSLDSASDFTTATAATGAFAGAKLRVNGGTLHTGSFVMQNVSAGFEITGGTATISGGISNLNPGDSGAFFVNATGGTLSAGSVNIVRGGTSITTEPTTGQTTNGFYINGAAVSITGAMVVGSGNSNSSTSARIDSGSLNIGGPLTVGIDNLSRWAVFDIGGGTFTSTDAGTGVRIGTAFNGRTIMHVRGGVATAERFQFGQSAFTGSAILNQTGGSLYVGSGGMVVGSTGITAQLRLGGGVLGATADSTSNVPVSLTGAAVVTGADSLDAPHTVRFSGSVTGTGSLTKNGSGTVGFTSPNTAFSGTVSVNSGTLGLAGQTGAVTVASTGTLIPQGTLNAQAASTIDGTLAIRYDVPALLSPGGIRSQGVLTLGAASVLDISGTGTLTAPFYTLASGTAGVSGTFASVTGTVPTGYTLVYNHNNGSGFPTIALKADTATAYDTWAASFGLNGASAGTTADPDNDGFSNLMEYALGRNPASSDGAGPSLGRSGDFLTLTFNHIGDANLVFAIEASENLDSAWSTVQTYPAFTTPGTSTYTDNVTVGSTNHRFIRLSVKSASY